MTRGFLRGRIGSMSSGEDKAIAVKTGPQVNIDFEVGKTAVLRPDSVVRGTVVLSVNEPNKTFLASSVKITFKGEEMATVKVREGNTVAGSPRREGPRTTYFERSHVVWTVDQDGATRGNEYRPWKELEPETHNFPFALKVPPVNFPPSIEGPKGLSIRYSWQAVVEGPGGATIEGNEVITPFVPTSFAPQDQEWIYKDVLYKDKKSTREPLIEVEAVLPRHVFSPGQDLSFLLRLTNKSGGRVTCVQCSLRKHYRGPTDKEFMCEKHERSLVSSERRCDISTEATGEIQFMLQVPPKHHHVPPTFTGRHLRVYYTLRCVVQAETGRVLTRMQFHEVIVPVAMSSYPHIPDQAAADDFPSYPSYTESHLAPFFFDPRDDFPPTIPTTQPLSTDPLSPCPSCAMPYSAAISGYSNLQLQSLYASCSDPDSSGTQSPYYSDVESGVFGDAAPDDRWGSVSTTQSSIGVGDS